MTRSAADGVGSGSGSDRGALGGELPGPLADYLHGLLQARCRPAFLVVAQDEPGTLLSAGGALVSYGLAAACVGEPVAAQVPLLTGMLPLPPDGEPLVLPWVNTDAGGFMDVHLVAGQGCDYVLCIEAAIDQNERVSMQQTGNELALQKYRQGQILDSHVGKYVAEQLLTGGLGLRPEGERREATLLFCDIRGFTTFAEQHPPQAVFRTLNELLQAMVQPILDQGGWLDKIAGDAVYSAFGLEPHAGPPAPQRAVVAGLAILRRVRAINDARRVAGLVPLGVGIGIATGAVAVGLLGTQERRQFAVIGHHVNLAARLQAQAMAGEIYLDQATATSLGELASRLSPRNLRLKGIREEIPAYVLSPEP
jgi:class 3 adenylate cyclase